MKKTYNKICKYCGDPFTADRANKEYCSPTHAKYEHQVRKGLRERPARILDGSGYVKLTDAEISQVNESISQLEDKLIELEKKILFLKEENDFSDEDFAPKIYTAIHKKIRLTEQRNILIRKLIDPNNMSGDQIDQYAKSKLIYPFSDYNEYEYLFKSIGDQGQPFRSIITGESGSGKTLLSLKIANHLIDKLEAQVLYVCDIEQENTVIQYAQYYSSLNQNFALRILTSELQIRGELNKKEYEFLIIDPLTSFISHRQFFQDMLITYPRLSIFGIATKTPNYLSGLIDFKIDISTKTNFATADGYEGNPISKIAKADVFSKGVRSKISPLVYYYMFKSKISRESFDPIKW